TDEGGENRDRRAQRFNKAVGDLTSVQAATHDADEHRDKGTNSCCLSWRGDAHVDGAEDRDEEDRDRPNWKQRRKSVAQVEFAPSWQALAMCDDYRRHVHDGCQDARY